MSIKFRQIKDFYDRYERILIPSALVSGVIVDFITFKSIQIGTAFLILGGHVLIAGTAIALLNTQSFRFTKIIAPLALQFSFGALLSASFIFYWFSGAFSVSWPILGAFGALMASNEMFRNSFQKPIVQLTVYYFTLFSIGTLVFPYALNSIDVSMFVLAGFVSMCVIALFILVLSRASESVLQLRSHLAIGVLSVFAFMNALYFLNIIPPIPLSLREAAVYHDVRLIGAQYRLTDEQTNFIDRLLPGQTIHIKKGERVYIYTSIFAPTKLRTSIFHRWQFYDETTKKWIDKDRLSFRISGGRDEGYRGYSFKTAVREGKWRVRVETQRGQVLGRVGFRVRHVSEDYPTISVVR